MDFSQPREHLSILNRWVDRYHIDVSDAYYVRNLVFGPQVLQGLQGLMKLPIDVHISVERPDVVVPAFVETNADTICLQIENISQQFFRLSSEIRAAGKGVGAVLSPLTGVDAIEYVGDAIDKVTVMTVDPGFSGQSFITSMLRKMEKLRSLRDKEGFDFAIEADGNVNEKTIPELLRSGADVLVMGSSGLFRPELPLEESARQIRQFCDEISGGAKK